MRFKAIQPDNPILRAEINYQQRILPRWLQWFDRFGVIALALAISLILLYTVLNGDFYGRGIVQYSKILDAPLLLLWITQFSVIFRCLLAGVNTIDYHKGTGSVLTLSDITPRKYLIGKFWGILYQLRGWIVAFGIIKLAVFVFVTLNLIVYCYRIDLSVAIHKVYDIHGTLLYPAYKSSSYLSYLPSLSRIVITGSHIVAISLLEIMASAAIGMIGGLIPRKIFGLSVAIAFRFAPVIIITIFWGFPYLWRNIFSLWYAYTWFSFVNGGSSAILRAGLFSDGYGLNIGITASILKAFWAAIIMYIVYLLFAFLVSHYLLRRQGFLSASSK